ncbi:MAG: ion channel [bacterium]
MLSVKANLKGVGLQWIDEHRHELLLLATVLVLVLPAFSGRGVLSNLLFVISMSFLLVQSVVSTRPRGSRRLGLRYLIVLVLITLFWSKPAGLESEGLDVVRLLLVIGFFASVTVSLARAISRCAAVNVGVILTAINIYLLIGIIAGNLSFLFHELYSGAYAFPAGAAPPDFGSFIYYSFVTMSTVGYGDITPRIPETQTLAYVMAIVGQLYVAIVIAFLVGKRLGQSSGQG